MKIQQNISLAPLNWFRTGGAAEYFCEPVSDEDFREALRFADRENLELFVLGEGANILISDDGFPGLVIRPKNAEIRVVAGGQPGDAVRLRTDGGADMQDVIEYCLERNILGLEEFSGIPGTVGGAVYINLHYFEYLLSDFLVSARVMHRESGEILEVDTDWFRFGYDTSRLHRKDHILLDAEFILRQGTEIEGAYARGRRDETIRHRERRYPRSHTCGSFFRNFLDEEVSLEINGTLMIFVAYYLDKLGIKGELSVGDAFVSFQHANMIVNRGKATSEDIAGLARKMQELVRDRYGVIPQPECQLVGFREHPLLT